MDDRVGELATGRRLVLGVSDNVAPDVNLDRLERVKDWIERFGAIA